MLWKHGESETVPRLWLLQEVSLSGDKPHVLVWVSLLDGTTLGNALEAHKVGPTSSGMVRKQVDGWGAGANVVSKSAPRRPKGPSKRGCQKRALLKHVPQTKARASPSFHQGRLAASPASRPNW